jgi:hypothetical protein
MSHECHDREELLRDARALTPRVQIQARLGGDVVSVFAGFRGEALSIYFGADPVFHFNANGQLRRAHVDGRLIKSDGGRLTAMERVHTPTAVELRAQRLSESEQDELLKRLAAQLADLRREFGEGRFSLEGQEPHNSSALDRFVNWLYEHPQPTTAQSPRVG